MLQWNLSNPLDGPSVGRRWKRRLPLGAPHRICNTDQGSQFTSSAFTDVLRRQGIAISMDG
ncbi:MAG: hypothetical protein HKM06_07140 [Spirochaetales bacterium]|nr:hypothetical protein [Spirochaetales bacterium]